MIRKEDFAVIQALHQRGVYQKDIAAELKAHPKTVSRALQRQGAACTVAVVTGRRHHLSYKLD